MGLLSAVLESAAFGAADKMAEDRKAAVEEKGAVLAAAANAKARTADLIDALKPGRALLAGINQINRWKTLRTELQRLRPIADTFASVRPDLETLRNEFVATSDKFECVYNLVTSSEDLEIANRCFERRRFREALELYNKTVKNLYGPVLYDDLKEKAHELRSITYSKRARCLSNIVRQWRQRLRLNVVEIDGVRQAIFEVNIFDRENFQEILNSLFISGQIYNEIDHLGHFINDTITPMLISGKSDIKVENDSNNVCIKIVENVDRKYVKNVSCVIDDFMLFFETIQFGIDCKWEDDRTVFSILGKIIGSSFNETFLEYLESNIPNDANLADSYSETIVQIDKFNTYLCGIYFSDTDKSPLSKFLTNVYDVIYDKRCQTLLSCSRTLMKFDLQNKIIKVSIGRKLIENTICSRNILQDPYLSEECQISDTTKTLMELISNELERAQNYTSDPSAKYQLTNKILSVLRNIFEMYYSLMPYFHRESLKNNPVEAALFYNNCFYLAHAMVGYPWCNIFPKDYALLVNLKFTDLIQNMRLSAIHNFSLFIKSQQQYIKKTITESELSKLEKINSIGSNSEIAISKCLEKLKSLQRHWQPILSVDTYEKTLADLIGCLCKELIDIILTIKEKIIGEDLALDISNMYQSVLKLGPQLITKHNDVYKLSNHFCRLSEMVTLLKSPMFSIASSWQAENSLISKVYTCEEVKHFIRIVFPGSLQKSAVLNMIQ